MCCRDTVVVTGAAATGATGARVAARVAAARVAAAKAVGVMVVAMEVAVREVEARVGAARAAVVRAAAAGMEAASPPALPPPLPPPSCSVHLLQGSPPWEAVAALSGWSGWVRTQRLRCSVAARNESVHRHRRSPGHADAHRHRACVWICGFISAWIC